MRSMHPDGWPALFSFTLPHRSLSGVSIRLREAAHHKSDCRTESNRTPSFRNPGRPTRPSAEPVLKATELVRQKREHG